MVSCSNSTLLPYSGCVTIVFASSALVGHAVCLPAQGALMCSQNLAWSGDPWFFFLLLLYYVILLYIITIQKVYII